MPAFFPAPLPDELLYSAFARFRDAMGPSSERSIIQTLFGSSTSTVIVDLPCRIDAFLSRLPPGNPLTARNIVQWHTTLPYYAPFLPPERVERTEALMHGNEGSTISGVLGLRPSRIQTPQDLRFCDKCADSDWRRFSVRYWHRAHQLSSVMVCPKHGTVLRKHFRSSAIHLFESLEQVLNQGKSISDVLLANTRIDLSCLQQLASETERLLNSHFRPPGLFLLQERYRSLLTERGWMKSPTNIRMGALRSAFTQHHGVSTLKELGCGLPSDRDGWLERLLRKPRSASHPLHHLLVLKFLGCSVTRFFSTNKGQQKSVGKQSPTGRQGSNNIATVSPYKKEGTVDTHNASWEARLISLVAHSNQSLRGIARELEVDPRTVQRHSRRIGVWRDEWTTWQKMSPSTRHLKKSEDMLRKYQKDWCELREKYPDEGTSALRRRVPAAYAFLYRNERDWLNAHKSTSTRVAAPTYRVDWTERDEKLLNEAVLIADELLNSDARPSWIRKTTILRRMRADSLYFTNIDKLPRTTVFLNAISENRSDFAKRKIAWSSQQFIQEGVQPERWELIRRASLRPGLANELDSETDEALENVQKHIGSQ